MIVSFCYSGSQCVCQIAYYDLEMYVPPSNSLAKQAHEKLIPTPYIKYNASGTNEFCVVLYCTGGLRE